MRAVINYEFLLAPLYLEDEEIFESVRDLVMCREHVANLSQPPVLEFDMILKMAEAGLYPNVRLYKDRFSVLQDCPFSAEDVSRIVNGIIDRGVCVSEISAVREVEWDRKCVSPEFFLGDNEVRKGQLFNNVEGLSLSSVLDGEVFGMLHNLSNNKDILKAVEFHGEINEVYPDVGCELPLAFSCSLPVFDTHYDFSRSLEPLELFRDSECDADLKFSFYLKAHAIAIESGRADSFVEWDSFHIGKNFFSSLKANQCANKGKFGSVLLDAVAHILAGSPKNNVNIFAVKAGSSSARTHGAYRAYRTHLIEGKQGLRLMYWQDDDNNLILANVGNKNELVIELP